MGMVLKEILSKVFSKASDHTLPGFSPECRAELLQGREELLQNPQYLCQYL